ncbi:MAG: hypothetical protein JWN86_1676 [Planctomycetota bacterium]|nr:hypothetical protein [Planctomycetota bacterium]
MLPGVGRHAYAIYMLALLKAAEDPTNPVERPMIEPLTMAHHAVGWLYYKASGAPTAEAANIDLSAAARLLGEHRKAVLALRAYRTSVVATPVTVVESRESADNGPRVAIVNGSVECEAKPDNGQDGQLEEATHGRTSRSA